MFAEGKEGETHFCEQCEGYAKRMRFLLKLIGNPGTCGKGVPGRGCDKIIFWASSKNGRPIPIDPDGTPHHATCVKVDRFRRPKEHGV